MKNIPKKSKMSEFQSVVISEKFEKKPSLIFRFIKLLVWIGVLFGSAMFYGYNSMTSGIIYSGENVEIYIPAGTGYSSLAGILNEQGFTIDKNLFKIYTRLNPVPELKEGYYEIKNDATLSDLITALEKPKPLKSENITILEGWNIYDIDFALTKSGLINSGDFSSIAENIPSDSHKKQFNFLENSLSYEGFLYPDTYTVLTDYFTIEDFIGEMLGNFDKKIVKKLEFKEDIYETIILASIVENEEKNPNNKSTVAGILKNRIKSGDFIGADITVCYPYKTTFSECTGSFIVKHLYEKNDYNTRMMSGLPKTPIGNPQFDTIKSTINYENTDYYYYLHDKSGIIRYSRTLEQHNFKKQKYLR